MDVLLTVAGVEWEAAFASAFFASAFFASAFLLLLAVSLPLQGFLQALGIRGLIAASLR